MGGIPGRALRRGPGRRRAAVVSVRDVEDRDFGGEQSGKPCARGFVQTPQRVADAVFRGEVEERSFPAFGLDQRVDLRDVAVGEEGRTGVRTQFHDMPGPVVLLVGPGLFVTLDDPRTVLFGAGRADHSGLGATVHHQLVQIEVQALVEGQRGFGAQAAEGDSRLGVDALVVEVDPRFEVDLWTGYMQKRQRVSRGQRRRFGGVDHVVGHGGDGGGVFRLGQQPVEGYELSHVEK